MITLVFSFSAVVTFRLQMCIYFLICRSSIGISLKSYGYFSFFYCIRISKGTAHGSLLRVNSLSHGIFFISCIIISNSISTAITLFRIRFIIQGNEILFLICFKFCNRFKGKEMKSFHLFWIPSFISEMLKILSL